jgi:hypothetical protein
MYSGSIVSSSCSERESVVGLAGLAGLANNRIGLGDEGRLGRGWQLSSCFIEMR